jgi:hypothetical protein
LTVRKTMPAIHIAPGMEYPNTVTDSAGTVWTLGTAYFTCTGGDCYPGPVANHSVAAAYAQFDQSTERGGILQDEAHLGWRAARECV